MLNNSGLFLSVPAYLDPGSGSMLLSAILGIVATLFFFFKTVFFKVVNLLGGVRFRKEGVLKASKIVFYSEGGQYWNVFKPIVTALSRRGIRCTYLSSKQNDPGLSCSLEHVDTRCIGEGNKAFWILNTLETDICVMTTPGLDVLQLKRKKGVARYCHVTHSAGGAAGYSTYGLDYYDAVLVGGEGDKAMIRELEAKRGLPAKEIVVVGCTYLDAMRERLAEGAKEALPTDSKKTILLSPTWGQHGLLRRCGESLLASLTGSNKYRVIVRPHPQSFVSDLDVIGPLMSKYPESADLVWDRQQDGLATMQKADLMISDFSGIVFDFLFLFEKPVLCFAGRYDKRGKDAMDLSDDPWNVRSINALGAVIDDKDVENIVDRIQNALSQKKDFRDETAKLRNDMDRYPNESGERAADALEAMLGEVSEAKANESRSNRWQKFRSRFRRTPASAQ